jgi:hypothetical protein
VKDNPNLSSNRKILEQEDNFFVIEESKNPRVNAFENIDFTFDENCQFPNRLGLREN